MNEIDERRFFEDVQYRLEQIEARLVFIENKIDEIFNNICIIQN